MELLTIATSWEQSNFNQHVVIAVKRPSNKVDETVIVSSVNSKGEITNNASVKLKKGLHYRATNQSWLRCGELNGNYRVDNGNNFRGTGQNRLAIWAYGINRKEYEVQFTLAPRIIR